MFSSVRCVKGRVTADMGGSMNNRKERVESFKTLVECGYSAGTCSLKEIQSVDSVLQDSR